MLIYAYLRPFGYGFVMQAIKASKRSNVMNLNFNPLFSSKAEASLTINSCYGREDERRLHCKNASLINRRNYLSQMLLR